MAIQEHGTELVRFESRMPRGVEINEIGALAESLAKSRMFKDALGTYQAFAKLLFGRDLGLSATAAMTGVHIIEGKPEIGSNLQAQMVKSYIGPEGERYDYRVLEHSATVCEIEFSRRRDGEWNVLGTSRYTMEDATKAGLALKDNYRKHPKNMLFARSLSDGVAFHCPEVTGGIRTYHEGEIEVAAPVTLREVAAAEPDGDAPAGDVVDAEVVPDPDPSVPVAAPAAAGERPATTAEKRGLRDFARQGGLSAVAFANVIKVALGKEPSASTDEAVAQRWLDREIDRLPSRLVDTVIDGIAKAAGPAVSDGPEGSAS